MSLVNSVRSVYIKITNYSGSITANLNNTIQKKTQTKIKKKQTKKPPQHAMKKPLSYSNRNNIYKGLLFVVEGSLAEKV